MDRAEAKGIWNLFTGFSFGGGSTNYQAPVLFVIEFFLGRLWRFFFYL